MESLDNPVLDYLKDRPSVIFSPKKLSRYLGIQKKHVLRYAAKCNEIKRASPHLVGSGKHELTLFYY